MAERSSLRTLMAPGTCRKGWKPAWASTLTQIKDWMGVVEQRAQEERLSHDAVVAAMDAERGGKGVPTWLETFYRGRSDERAAEAAAKGVKKGGRPRKAN